MDKRAVSALLAVGVFALAGLAAAADTKTSAMKPAAAPASQIDKGAIAKRFTKVNVQNVTASRGGTAVITADLISPDGQPLSGKPVIIRIGSAPYSVEIVQNMGFDGSTGTWTGFGSTFVVNSNIFHAQTNRIGKVAMEYKIPYSRPPGSYHVEVRFDGDERSPIGVGGGTLIIKKEATKIKIELPSEAYQGENVTVFGQLVNLAQGISVMPRREFNSFLNGVKVKSVPETSDTNILGHYMIPQGTSKVDMTFEFPGDAELLPSRVSISFNAFPPRQALKNPFINVFPPNSARVGDTITIRARVIQGFFVMGQPSSSDWDSPLVKGAANIEVEITDAAVYKSNMFPAACGVRRSGCSLSCIKRTDQQGWVSCNMIVDSEGQSQVMAMAHIDDNTHIKVEKVMNISK